MRALSEFFVTLAAIATIAAATVRIWWSKPKTRETGPVQDSKGEYWFTTTDEPKAPPWLRKLAKVWLYVVAIGVTISAIVIAIVFVIRIIDISH